jgi:hypothetical protein
MHNDATLNNGNALNPNRFRSTPFNQKFSTASSVTSTDELGFFGRLYQKCQIVCCMCGPN